MTRQSNMEKKVNDCWNHIGIWGKEKTRCSELQKVVHCRNCKVYSKAGRCLLERTPPDGYLDELKKVIAKEHETEDYKTESIVIFRLGYEWLALPTMLFKEVICMRKVHTLPHRRYGSLKGLVNVHGELLICISLGRLLGIDKQEITEVSEKKIYKRFIVFSGDGGQYVFPVSEIKGIHRYAPSEIYHAPSTAAYCASSYLKGMLDLHGVAENENVLHVGCLDGQKLLNSLKKEVR